VDCDPNPNLAESFGLDSRVLPRYDRAGLRRAGDTLALAREPKLVAVEAGVWLLAGPPSGAALSDAVARGIAGVLLAERFDAVVTDLGAGPEFAEMAVGGALNPADVCVVLSTGSPVADLTADRIERACAHRSVPSLRMVVNCPEPRPLAGGLADRLLDSAAAI
jgi:hypothetical protein